MNDWTPGAFGWAAFWATFAVCWVLWLFGVIK